MKASGPSILTINGGSSSIKFALYELDNALVKLLEGRIDGVGLQKGSFTIKGLHEADKVSQPAVVPDYQAAVHLLMDWNQARMKHGALAAVGHRVVHGGPKFWEPQRITAEMIEELRQLIPLDPEHLPEELLLIESFQRQFPDMPQVACFDTEFHRDMPSVAKMLPIPRRYAARGLRRYGFHGLSYAYLMQELGRCADPKAASGRVILAHLGSGASLAAVHGGRSMDTTMCLTPASGLMMSTRSGDVDPGLVSFLARSDQMSVSQFDHMVNHQSGLLGVSEISSDMRDLLARQTEDTRAAEAVSLFCYQVKKCIGAYAAALGGLDTLIFAEGIGERSDLIRARSCEGLSFLGINLDQSRNYRHAAVISTDDSRVTVRVICTDEELMIARSVCRVLGLEQKSNGIEK